MVFGMITGEYAVKPGALAGSNNGDWSLLAHLPRFPLAPSFKPLGLDSLPFRPGPQPRPPERLPLYVVVFSTVRIFLAFSHYPLV